MASARIGSAVGFTDAAAIGAAPIATTASAPRAVTVWMLVAASTPRARSGRSQPRQFPPPVTGAAAGSGADAGAVAGSVAGAAAGREVKAR